MSDAVLFRLLHPSLGKAEVVTDTKLIKLRVV